MTVFLSEDFEKQIRDAVSVWERFLGIKLDEFCEDLSDILNLSSLEDKTIFLAENQRIGASTRLYVTLPESEDIAMRCEEFIKYSEELDKITLIDNSICYSHKRYLQLVEPASLEIYDFITKSIPLYEYSDDEALYLNLAETRKQRDIVLNQLKSLSKDNLGEETSLFQEFKDITHSLNILEDDVRRPVTRYLSTKILIDGNDAICSLISGLTIFNLKIAAMGEYSDFYPPIEDHIFIEIQYSTPPKVPQLSTIVDAYIFELSSSLKFDLRKSIRPYKMNEEISEDYPSKPNNYRLRPLIFGKGLADLLALYNDTVSAIDTISKIITLNKIIEFVSQTVIRQQHNSLVRMKLLSSDALDPAAEFIDELTRTILDENKSTSNDREAMKRTIIVCCDPYELSKYAPDFLTKLKSLTSASKEKEHNEALSQFANALVSTRNQVAHAKANYRLAGDECPSDQIYSFLECVQLAAQQCIRWYQGQPENTRVG